MTDKEFIYNFLNNGYQIIFDEHGLKFKDLKTSLIYNSNDFKNNFIKIIGTWETDERFTTFDIAVDWFNEKKEEYLKDLVEYLNDVIFELGINDWIAKKLDGNIVTLENIIFKFNGKYSKETITHFYGDWYSDKVCQASEKIINKW